VRGLLLLVTLEREHERDLVADRRNAALHAEVRPLELADGDAAAALLVVAGRRVALEALDRERQRVASRPGA
jgi:hypothetical protein